jgi:hypothetical protein
MIYATVLAIGSDSRRFYMHRTKDIILEASELPVEDRVRVVDSLLRTLNIPNPDIDRAWARLAKNRLAELRSGQVKPISGHMVFAKIRKRFAR